MFDKVMDLSLVPITNGHSLVIRCRTKTQLAVAMCFSQVSAGYCLKQFFNPQEEHMMDPQLELDGVQIEDMMSTEQIEKLPDFDVNEEIFFDETASAAISNLLDQWGACDPATLRREHSRFAYRFRSGAASPLPSKLSNNWSLYAPSNVAVLFAKAKPYKVNMLYCQSDIDMISTELDRVSIDPEVYRKLLPPYEDVWDLAVTLEGPAAETIAFMMWIYTNSLNLDEALAKRQP